MKPLATLTAATAVALASLGLGAGVAGAAVSTPFDLRAGTEKTPGKAHAVGALSILGPKKFDVSGRVDDICPRDGYGAYVYVSVTFDDNSTRLMQVGADARDCDARGTVAFSTTRTVNRRIKKLQLNLQEEDLIGPDLARIGDIDGLYFWPDGRVRKI